MQVRLILLFLVLSCNLFSQNDDRFEKINKCFNAKTQSEFEKLTEEYKADDEMFKDIANLLPLMDLDLTESKTMMNALQCGELIGKVYEKRINFLKDENYKYKLKTKDLAQFQIDNLFLKEQNSILVSQLSKCQDCEKQRQQLQIDLNSEKENYEKLSNQYKVLEEENKRLREQAEGSDGGGGTDGEKYDAYGNKCLDDQDEINYLIENATSAEFIASRYNKSNDKRFCRSTITIYKDLFKLSGQTSEKRMSIEIWDVILKIRG